MPRASRAGGASTAFARRYLVVAGVLQLGVGLITAYFAGLLSTVPPCGASITDCHYVANASAAPELWGATVVASGLATVIGVALMRRRHRPAWWLAVAGQFAALVAIIVPVAREMPYEIGWGFLAVFPTIGLGLLLNSRLRVARAESGPRSGRSHQATQ